MPGKRLLLALAVFLFALPAAGQEKPKVIDVEINSSYHLKLGAPISRVFAGAAEVADVNAFAPDNLIITGKRVGQTTATVWVRDEILTFEIRVGFPVDQMTDAIRAAVPDGKDLKVSSAGGAVAISGQVTDVADVQKIEDIVRGYLGGAEATNGDAPSIVNLVTVPGDQQVELQVSFAEVSRTALKEIGVNYSGRNNAGKFAGAIVAPTSTAPDPTTGTSATGILPAIAAPLTGTFGAVFATAANSAFPFSAALSVLSQHGYARTLSEPTLVAMSGQEATFLAGGEFPIVIPGALGTFSVEFKKFGIQLAFQPTVVGDSIQLKLSTEVSDVDNSLGITIGGVSVPGLTSRQAASTVRLRDGQSFAIAGLLSDKVRSTVSKIPGLGDLPILGLLFRSLSYERDETEFVVVVTARLVRPQGDRPVLPGEDTLTDPGDLELFLLGSGESKSGSDPLAHPAKKPAAAKPVGMVGFAR